MRTGFRADGTITFRDIEADYLLGAYADISDRVVGKGTYPSCGPVPSPGGPDRRAQRPVAHAAVDGLPRLRRTRR